MKRGRKPTIDAADITRAAIAVADAEGLAAVSMARVAQEMGNATMALYRHVKSKDELLTLMGDAAIGRPAPVAGRRLARPARVLGESGAQGHPQAPVVPADPDQRAADRAEEPRVVRQRARRTRRHAAGGGGEGRRRDGPDDVRARRGAAERHAGAGLRGRPGRVRQPSTAARCARSSTRAGCPRSPRSSTPGCSTWTTLYDAEDVEAEFDFGLHLFLEGIAAHIGGRA